MFGLGERLAVDKSRKQTGEDLSQLMQDVDKVWMSDRSPSGDPVILRELSGDQPGEAAEKFRQYLIATDAITLADRIDPVGIALGILTKNRGIPSGVKAVWRSDLPVLLVTEEVPVNYDRALEIARELGALIYHGQPESSVLVAEFAQQIYDVFVEIAGDGLPQLVDSPRQGLLHRMLGAVASK